MEVLLTLTDKPGKVISRTEIERAVWPGRVVTEDAVTNAVVKLRKAIGDSARHPRFIETIAKRGYRLMVEPALETPASMPAPDQSIPHAPERLATAAPKPAALGALAALVALGLAVAVGLWIGTNPNEASTELGGPEPSIAVLPLDTLADAPGQSYFAEGITLDLITELSRIPGLLVIAHGTASGYRRSNASDPELGEQLGVSYLVRGGVQRSRDRLRINVRLIETGKASTLWAGRFEGEQGQVFRIQDQVVAGIAEALRDALQQPLDVPKRGQATRSIAAYDAFLRGQERYGRRTPDEHREALALFERAASLDPAFARAYAGQALAWSRLAIDGWNEGTQDALEKAAVLARKAADIDPEIPQIHFVQAQVALFRGRHEHAADAAATAIELNPNYADAQALLAWVLHYAGRPDQALPALREALKRNPGSAASYHEIAGEVHFAAERYQQALEELRIALDRNPAHVRARLLFAASLSALGQTDRAEWEAQELLSVHPRIALSQLPRAFPFKDPRQLESLTNALRRVGLPEHPMDTDR